ncbi:hypothetical protein [Burkholderia lata]|uniref:hypothetical protein n=1 Tax=Burkholderia lata (strain ATCC 17760 / DSM 23089 / LMG 22485 / NCIMB 9086 / R18194 / 383) TaxID=482957 RepID=UPI001582F728|nr:hypothetical protein [Burkholderia lata]
MFPPEISNRNKQGNSVQYGNNDRISAPRPVENAARLACRDTPAANLSPRDWSERQLNVFSRTNAMLFFTDFFSLESISNQYPI